MEDKQKQKNTFIGESASSGKPSKWLKNFLKQVRPMIIEVAVKHGIDNLFTKEEIKKYNKQHK